MKKRKIISKLIALPIFILFITIANATYITEATGFLYTQKPNVLVLAKATTLSTLSANELRHTYSSTSGFEKQVRSGYKTKSFSSSNVAVGPQTGSNYVVDIVHDLINNSTTERVLVRRTWAPLK